METKYKKLLMHITFILLCMFLPTILGIKVEFFESGISVNNSFTTISGFYGNGAFILFLCIFFLGYNICMLAHWVEVEHYKLCTKE
jgi:hypothetical protein